MSQVSGPSNAMFIQSKHSPWTLIWATMRKRGWRWVFSSSRLTQVAKLGPPLVQNAFHAFFSLLLPDDCRVCGKALQKMTRTPVCAACLRQAEPLNADFFCVSCRTPFQNRFPLDEQGRCALCRSGLRGFDAAYSFG